MNICVLGNAGAGKSTVAAGIGRQVPSQVIDSDELLRLALASGTDGRNRAIIRFGESIVTADGEIDPEDLRSRTVKDPAAGLFLTNVTEPVIRDQIQQRVAIAAAQASHFVLDSYEMIESKWFPDVFHHAAVVITPFDKCVARLRLAHGWSDAKARAVLGEQMSSDEILSEAKKLFGRRLTIIYNDGGLAELQTKVHELLNTLLAGRRDDEGQRLWAEFLENESSHMLSIFIAEEQRASWLLTASAALLAVIVAGKPTIAIAPLSLFFLALITLCLSVVMALLAMYPVDGYKRFYGDLLGTKYRRMRDLSLPEFVVQQAKPGAWSSSDYFLRVQYHYRSHWLIAFRRKRMMAWATLLTLLGVVLAATYVVSNLI